MNAPKKIYLNVIETTFGYEEQEGDTTYIREDVVLELVEALKYCLQFNGHAFMYDDTKAQAAIKKLEDV